MKKRMRRGRGELGAAMTESVIAGMMLVPVAIGVGLLLENVSQARGEAGVRATQYLIPCSGGSVLNQNSDECQ